MKIGYVRVSKQEQKEAEPLTEFPNLQGTLASSFIISVKPDLFKAFSTWY